MKNKKSLLLISSFISLVPTLAMGACNDSFCSNPDVPLFAQGDGKLASYISSQVGRTVKDTGWCGGVASAMVTRGIVLSSGLKEADFARVGFGGNFQTKHLDYYQDRLNPEKYAQIYDVMRKVGTDINSGGTYNSSVKSYIGKLFGDLASYRGGGDFSSIRYNIRNSSAVYWMAVAAYKNGSRQWGHSIVIRGYDQDKLIVNDPWGKIYNMGTTGWNLTSTEGGSVQTITNSKMEAKIDGVMGISLKKSVNSRYVNDSLAGDNSQKVLGQVSASTLSGSKYYLKGWACGFGADAPARVSIKAGNDLLSAVYLGDFVADKTSGLDTTRNCGNSGATSYHTYQIEVTKNMAPYVGKKLWVVGVSPDGQKNNLLLDSGVHKVPDLRQTIGTIDKFYVENGTHYVNGWACAYTYSKSINVQLYSTATTKDKLKYLTAGTANLVNEQGVSDACGSTAKKFRFKIAVSDAIVKKYSTQKIYAKGISPFKYANNNLKNSAKFALKDMRAIVGKVEKISADKNSIEGWACAYSSNQPVSVHLYVNGAAGAGGKYISAVKANLTSLPTSTEKSCGNSATAYGFKIPLSNAIKTANANSLIYVHGISPYKLENKVISNSGKLKIPAVTTAAVAKK